MQDIDKQLYGGPLDGLPLENVNEDMIRVRQNLEDGEFYACYRRAGACGYYIFIGWREVEEDPPTEL